MASPGATTAAGYGYPHQKLRAQVKRDVVDPGNGWCWRCGKWLDPALPWHLGHDDHDRTLYRGPECVKCNSGTFRRREDGVRRWEL